MQLNQFSLLTTRRFLPLFITQFLGAFNDNVYKNAIVLLFTYSAAYQTTMQAEVLVMLAAGIFIVPMVIFSATAGQLADKYNKATMIKIVKLAEILIMLLACVGFYLANVPLLLIILFFMGSQSAFFGPLKYSILPFHLTQHELLGGNALVQAATFIAILIGTLVGTLVVLQQYGVLITAILVVLLAVAGFISSCWIPATNAQQPDLNLNWNIITNTWRLLCYSCAQPLIFVAILAISWFWLVGAAFVVQFAPYVKQVIGGAEDMVALLLMVFSIGVGLGALLCNRILRGKIVLKYVPWAGLGIALFGIEFYFASVELIQVPLLQPSLFNIWQNISMLRLLFALFAMAVCGGIYVVPLYTALQILAATTHKARIIASNNVMNSLFMAISAAGIAMLLKFNFSIHQVFLLIALATICVVGWLYYYFTKNAADMPRAC